MKDDTDEHLCCHSGGRIRGFMKPWILLHLLQKPCHGYELLERISRDSDITGSDPGLLYRTLRQWEEEGYLTSTWDTGGTGPARRLYHVTAEGVEYLHAWAVRIRNVREKLSLFLNDYEQYFKNEGEHP